MSSTNVTTLVFAWFWMFWKHTKTMPDFFPYQKQHWNWNYFHITTKFGINPIHQKIQICELFSFNLKVESIFVNVLFRKDFCNWLRSQIFKSFKAPLRPNQWCQKRLQLQPAFATNVGTPSFSICCPQSEHGQFPHWICIQSKHPAILLTQHCFLWYVLIFFGSPFITCQLLQILRYLFILNHSIGKSWHCFLHKDFLHLEIITKFWKRNIKW